MTRRGGALALIAISALFVAAVPVSAATESVAAVTVPASVLGVAAVGGATTSHGFTLAADPGGSATRTLVVTNRSSDLRLTVRLAPSGSMANWLTLSDVVETLEPGASATVNIAILVPANAIPGNVVAGVGARVDQAVRVADATSVSGNPKASLPVAIKVNGAPTAQVSIVNVQSVRAQGKDYLEVEFRNVGATPMVMYGHINVAGTHSQALPVHANAAPLTATTIRVPWVKPSGSKGATVTVGANDARGDQASWNGVVGAAPPPTTAPSRSGAPSGAPAPSPHRAHAPYVLFVLIAVALALTWFVYELARARVRRRALAVRLPVATSAVAVPAGTAAAPAQIDAIAIQLGALVGAIDRLVGRLDSAPVGGSPVDDAPVEPASVPSPATAAAEIEIAFRGASALPNEPTDATTWVVDPGYPYDWPTEEQLDRFLQRRRGVEFDR